MKWPVQNKGSYLLLLNVIYWAVAFFVAHGFNTGNEHLYKIPIRQAPFYWPAMLGMAAVQALLLYTQTGFLLGRLWERRRKWACIAGLLILWILVANLAVLVMKLAQPQLPVHQFTHVGFINGPLPPEWNLAAWMEDLLTYLIGYLFWMVVYTLAWFTRKFFRQRRLLREVQLQKKESELQFLKQQLNPHFLFNTLNNLYGLALQKSEQMPEMLLRLSEMMHYMIYESTAALVPFEKEKEALLSYIQLEQLRLPQEVEVHCEVVADAPYSIPPLLWLPIVENIFKHGCLDKENSVSLRFRIWKNQFELHAANTCTDSKIPAAGSGIGLKNLEERLRLLFPDKHQLQQEQHLGSFEIKLSIQLKP